MASESLGDLLMAGIDVLKTTVSAKTKRIVAQLGNIAGQNGAVAEVDNVEWWQHVGFASRPSMADPGKAACQAIGFAQGGTDFIVASQDARGLELSGNLSEGETCVYASGKDGKGQARALFKADGSVSLYTKKGNTDSGGGIMLQLDAAAGAIRMMNDQGYGIIIDADGVKVTSKGACLNLTAAGDASLIGKGNTQVDGSGVVIGSIAVPGLNSALTGVTGIAGKASLKVLIE